MVMVETLWETYHDEIFRYVNSRLGDPERARDLTQDVFETIIAHEDQLGDIRNFDRWIYRVAKNRLIDHTRKKREARLERQQIVPARSESDDIESLVGSISACLKRIIQDYDPEQAETLIAIFGGRITQKHAARELGIPYSTLKSRVQKAREVVFERFVDECCELIRNSEGNVINCRPVSKRPPGCD